MEAGRQKQEECRGCHDLPLFPCQAVAEQPDTAVHTSQVFFFFSHRSVLLISLFSRMVNCSMMNPFGLSSERPVFWSEQVVTKLRSVTLLSRIII